MQANQGMTVTSHGTIRTRAERCARHIECKAMRNTTMSISAAVILEKRILSTLYRNTEKLRHRYRRARIATPSARQGVDWGGDRLQLGGEAVPVVVAGGEVAIRGFHVLRAHLAQLVDD